MKVDKELKKVYLELLKEMLLTPEKWKSSDVVYTFTSPYINKETKIQFKIEHDMNNFEVFIYKNDYRIYELKISWWDFKTSILIHSMYLDTIMDRKKMKMKNLTMN